MSDYETSVRSFVFDIFLFGTNENALSNDDFFLEQGIIDPTDVLELVKWLEETFDIKVEDDELVPENLDSVSSISAFIEKKRQTETEK